MQIRLCMSRGYLRLMGDKTFFFVTVFGMFIKTHMQVPTNLSGPGC